MATQKEMLAQLAQGLEEITKEVASLKDQVGGLFEVKSSQKERTFAVAAPTPNLSDRVTDELGESDPIKLEYRQVVDNKLNKSFGVHQKFTEGGFAFTVIVPEKYSTLTPAQKAQNTPDFRTKIISYAEGLLGVEEWVDLVYKNFGPDIQAVITADRLAQ